MELLEERRAEAARPLAAPAAALLLVALVLLTVAMAGPHADRRCRATAPW